MKGLAPVYNCTEKCGVKGRKTVVDNPNKVKEAGTPYVRRVTLVPLVCPIVCAWPQRRQGHSSVDVGQEVSSVLVVVLHLKNGVQRVLRGRGHPG
jgi:hypothetical protein